MDLKNFLKKNWFILLLVVAILIGIIICMTNNTSSFTFNEQIISNNITDKQPKQFPPLTSKVNDFIPLEPPTVPEEIGLAMKYPQGSGVGMSKMDSNSFTPGNPGPLLTDYKNPEAYGESSLTDLYGVDGANQGSRIIRIKDLGTQLNFKPMDEAVRSNFAQAYSNNPNDVQSGLQPINGTDYINYSDNFNPSENLKLQSSPGQMSSLPNCETTYPYTEKYEDFCITEGDIPYGKIVNGRVNPRLVDRWQSYTGDYNPQDALQQIDGLLYPILNGEAPTK
jgi:hypothetical protein